MNRRFLLLISIFCLSTQAYANVDETWGSSLSSRTSLESFDAGNSLKAKKKVGVATTFAGATGLVGLNFDLNFSSDFAISFGAGISRGFQSFNANVKLGLGGEQFLPYFVTGFSRWYANGDGAVDSTSPGLLADKFLSSGERSSGKFSENIIYPGLGLQYLTLDGDWAGFGVFGEILALLDIDDFVIAPTAGIGSIYYF